LNNVHTKIGGTTTQFTVPLWHTIITDGSTINNNKLRVITLTFSSCTDKKTEMDQQPLFFSVANKFIGSPAIYDFSTHIVNAIYESTRIICFNSLIVLDLITLITLYHHQNIFVSIINKSVNEVILDFKLLPCSECCMLSSG